MNSRPPCPARAPGGVGGAGHAPVSASTGCASPQAGRSSGRLSGRGSSHPSTTPPQLTTSAKTPFPGGVSFKGTPFDAYGVGSRLWEAPPWAGPTLNPQPSAGLLGGQLGRQLETRRSSALGVGRPAPAPGLGAPALLPGLPGPRASANPDCEVQPATGTAFRASPPGDSGGRTRRRLGGVWYWELRFRWGLRCGRGAVGPLALGAEGAQGAVDRRGAPLMGALGRPPAAAWRTGRE